MNCVRWVWRREQAADAAQAGCMSSSGRCSLASSPAVSVALLKEPHALLPIPACAGGGQGPRAQRAAGAMW